MTTIELTKSGIAMKKLRGDPEKYVNERILTLMSTIGGRNELHYVSKLLLCAFDHENLL